MSARPPRARDERGGRMGDETVPGRDTLGAVMDEVAEVFRFDHASRPQDRVRAYLARHQVCRGFGDTAVQCAAADMVRRAYACGLADAGSRPAAPGEVAETVSDPAWYTSGPVETIEKVESVVDGLPAVPAFLLGQVVRYVDRAGMKDEAATDLGKADNYATRLVTGEWRKDG